MRHEPPDWAKPIDEVLRVLLRIDLILTVIVLGAIVALCYVASHR